MPMNPTKPPHPRSEAAADLVALLHRLGLAALVRDPLSADVLAASPAAEEAILGAEPGLVSVVSARVGGHEVRVEALRTGRKDRHSLTPRQREVADALMEGSTNVEIGQRFGISEHTVRRHVEEILRRLGVANRRAAAEELKRRHGVGTPAGRRQDDGGTVRA
jgi:DNA-binding NarL/FixJ family response regulator